MTKKTEDDFQQKYMQYNVYKQQAEGLVKELSMLNQTAQSLKTSRDVLSSLEGEKKKATILVPLGGNAFLKAKIEDTDSVLVGVGADVVLSKPTADARTLLDEQLENLKTAGDELAQRMNDLELKMRNLEPELQKMMAQQQGKHTH